MPKHFISSRTIVRAVTGLALTAVAVLLVTVLSSRFAPEITRPIPSYTVDTTGTTHDTLVCPGSFRVLGVNSSSPNDAIGVGSTASAVSDSDAERSELAQEFAGDTPATAHTITGTDSFTGAQQQRLSEETATGQTAAACQEPMNDQWIAGGTTLRGTSNVITLANSGNVPATVTITVYDEEGIVENVGTTGVLVPPETQSTLPLAGFGVERASTVVHVQSAGSPVAATLGVHQVRDINAIGADTVNAQYAPATTLAFTGIHHQIETGHTDAGDATEVPITVRLMSPGADTGATLTGHTENGDTVELGHVELTADTVTDTELHSLPDSVTAITATADEAMIGGVRTDVLHSGAHDFTWVSPATIVAPDHEVNAVVLKGGTLTLVNLDDEGAEFEVGDETVKLDGHATWQGKTAEQVTLSGETSFAAGVTLTSENTVASYPVLEETAQLEQLTIYTR